MSARRGICIVILLIVSAAFISAPAMLVRVRAVGRERPVASNATLVRRIGGGLNEMEPGGAFGPLFEAPPTVRSIVGMLRKAQTDKRITSVILKPTEAAALWGKTH